MVIAYLFATASLLKAELGATFEHAHLKAPGQLAITGEITIDGTALTKRQFIISLFLLLLLAV